MRLGIDASPAVVRARSGVGTYIRRLLHAYGELAEELLAEDTVHVLYRLSRWKHRARRVVPEGPRFRTRWIQEPCNALFIRSLDVYHGPDIRLWKRRWSSRPPMVATIHDLFSLEQDDWADERFRTKRHWHYRRAKEQADRIITHSRWARRRVLDYLQVPEERVTAVHLAPAHLPEPGEPPPRPIGEVRKQHGLRGPYVLYVGELAKRKNLPLLARSFLEARREVDPDLRLVLAGKPSFGFEEIEETIRREGLEDWVIRTGAVPPEDLPGLYEGASAFAFLSLAEGFGMPVLEAMASGVPVVASNTTALPEVAGDAALLVDPEDGDAVTGALVKALGNTDLRDTLIERGLRRASRFTWQRTARETLEVLRACCP